MTRFFIGLALIFIIFFAGHSIYYRGKTDQLLQAALKAIPTQPADAYTTFKPINSYDNVVTFGKAAQAQQIFIESLRIGVCRALSMNPAQAEAFSQAQQALHILDQFQEDTRHDMSGERVIIFKAARNSMEPIRDYGTLSAWNALISFFDEAQRNGKVPDEVFDDFGQWFAQVKAVPLRPLGLRDAQAAASACFQNALLKLGVAATTPQGPLTAPMPVPMSDMQLIQAEKLFQEGQTAIKRFSSLFPDEPQTPPELLGLSGKFIYNRGVLKLAHLIERGESVHSQGSDYIAELLINPNAASVPSYSEMYGSFVNGALAEFKESLPYLQNAPTLDGDTRNVLMGLALWDYAWLCAVSGTPNRPERAQAEQCFAAASSAAARQAIDSLRASNTPLLAVQIP